MLYLSLSFDINKIILSENNNYSDLQDFNLSLV